MATADVYISGGTRAIAALYGILDGRESDQCSALSKEVAANCYKCAAKYSRPWGLYTTDCEPEIVDCSLTGDCEIIVSLADIGNPCDAWFLYALAHEFGCTPAMYFASSEAENYRTDDMGKKYITWSHVEIAWVSDKRFYNVLKPKYREEYELDRPYEREMVIPDLEAFVRERFRIIDYALLREFVSGSCPNSIYSLCVVKREKFFKNMRPVGNLLRNLKVAARRHGIALPELRRLREKVWGMDIDMVKTFCELTSRASRREVCATLLALGLK